MATREELIEIGRDTMGRSSSWRWWSPRHLTMLLDVWEPMIRADECLKSTPSVAVIGAYRDDVLRVERERLRAQVEALRDEYDESPYPYTHNAMNRVLALLDGEPNG